MIDSIKLYFQYINLSLRAQMEYKASFIMMSTGQFLVTIIDFLGIWVLFDRFNSLQGWSLPEVALFYGMVNTSFALAEAWPRGFDTFHNLVRTGDFDRIFLRPRSAFLQIIGLFTNCFYYFLLFLLVCLYFQVFLYFRQLYLSGQYKALS